MNRHRRIQLHQWWRQLERHHHDHYIKAQTVAGGLREGPLPSAEIDGAGTVYIVWADSRFRTGGKVNDM